MQMNFTTQQQIMKTEGIVSAKIKVVVFSEDDIFVAFSPALNLSSYGDTVEEAKQAFDEAVEIFFEETRKKGTLERELLKLGWRLQIKPQPSYQPPAKTTALKGKSITKSYGERVAIPW